MEYVVLELVLTDLTKYEGSNLPLSIGHRIPRDVYFSRVPPKIWVEGGRIFPLKPTPPNTWKDFRSAEDGIRVVDGPVALGEGTETPYAAHFPVKAWMPEFSPNRSRAVVRVYFPEILHPSYGTYVLLRQDGTWTITRRRFDTYL